MSVIAYKAKGLLLPEPFMQRALKDAKAVGYALKDGSSLCVEWANGVNEAFIKDLVETQKAFEDDPMMFVFMDKVISGEEQPYAIVADANKDFLLAGFAEGKFRNFIPTAGDDGHTNEWWMFNKYLKPKLTKMHTQVGLHSMWDELQDDVIKAELEGLGDTAGGTLVLFDSNGREMCFTNSDKFRKFSWGYASDHLDIAEADEHKTTDTAVEEEIVGETRVQKLKRLKAAKAAAEAAAPIIAGAQQSETTGKTEQTSSATYPADTGTEYMNITPPDEITSNNKLKQWYQTTSLKYSGYSHLPKEWKERVALRCKKPVTLVKPTVVKDFKEIPKDKIEEIKSNTKPIASTEPIKQPEKKGVAEEVLPIISPKVKEAVSEEFGDKILDKNSMEIPLNPEKLQEEEKKFPTYWEATGISRDITDRYSDEARRDLCRKYPDAAAVLLKNYMIDSIVNRPQEEQDEEDTVDTSGTGMTKEESKMDRLRRLKAERKAAM